MLGQDLAMGLDIAAGLDFAAGFKNIPVGAGYHLLVVKLSIEKASSKQFILRRSVFTLL